MFDRILVVCMGNICRSPLGEAMLKEIFPNKVIDSAGIGTELSGLAQKPADVMMKKIAQSNGYDLSNHQAKQLTPELCNQADLILVMEQRHIKMVENISLASRGKTMLYAHWSRQDIPDPYRKSEEVFEYVLKMMQSATEKWQDRL